MGSTQFLYRIIVIYRIHNYAIHTDIWFETTHFHPNKLYKHTIRTCKSCSLIKIKMRSELNTQIERNKWPHMYIYFKVERNWICNLNTRTQWHRRRPSALAILVKCLLVIKVPYRYPKSNRLTANSMENWIMTYPKPTIFNHHPDPSLRHSVRPLSIRTHPHHPLTNKHEANIHLHLNILELKPTMNQTPRSHLLVSAPTESNTGPH